MNIISIQKLSDRDSWRNSLCVYSHLGTMSATHLIVAISDGGSRVRKPVCDEHARQRSEKTNILIQEALDV